MNGSLKHHERKRKFIINCFFQRCAKAPLSSLKFFMETGEFPDEAKIMKFYEENRNKTFIEEKEHFETEKKTQATESLPEKKKNLKKKYCKTTKDVSSTPKVGEFLS